jgi:O-antigen/teichoic acid export membrane protein
VRDLASLSRRINLRKNVSFSVAEFGINALLLFVGYRLVIEQSGIEAIGVWSSLYAWANLVRLGDPGVAAAAPRFLALWDVTRMQKRVRAYAETALLTNVAQYGLLSALAYVAMSVTTRTLVGAAHEAEAAAVLPLLIIGFFLMNVSGAILATLQGLHIGYLRAKLSVAGTIIQLVAVVVLVPKWGLQGFAWAQILQHGILIPLGWHAVRIPLDSAVAPIRFSRKAFRDMLSYSIRAQLVNISNGLVEPVSKLLVGHFGGMATQGLYELAYKTVLIPRNLVVTAITSSSPAVTALFRENRQHLAELYARAFRTTVLVMGAVAVVTIALAPGAAVLWLGSTNDTYHLYVLLLSAAFIGNVIGAPGYVLGMASGRMRNNIITTVATLAFLIFAGWPSGLLFGGTGAVAVSAVAIGAGGIAIWRLNRQLLSA